MATKPGQIVSVDQMISMQVGFIAQLKGGLTKKRYTATTVFTDHYSRLQYIHLMTCLLDIAYLTIHVDAGAMEFTRHAVWQSA